MGRRYYKSTAVATTLSGGSLSAGATSMTVSSVTGWPTSYPFTAILDPDTANEEVVEVTAGSGTSWSAVTRGVDGTSAVSHSSGAAVRHGVSARDFDEPNAHIAATTGVHGITDTSALVTTASTGLAPVGSVTAYAGAVAPSGWLLCDGSVVAQATYPALYAVVGATYNTSGEGAGNFRLPNLKGKVPVGLDTGQTEFDALGEAGGSKTSTAPHTHDINHDHGSFTTASGGGHDHRVLVYNSSGTTDTIPSTGGALGDHYSSNAYTEPGTGSHTHSIDVPALGTTPSGESSAAAASGNLQPYLTLNFIIRAA